MSSATVEITERQLIPLSLLEAAGGEISGRTRLQKLAFLLVEEELDDDFPRYDFVKYNYGPFSKTLLDDIERLEHDGVVGEKETKTFSGNRRHDYKLNDGFSSVVSRIADDEGEVTKVLTAAEQIVEEHNDKALRTLVEDVYDEYPEYLEHSVYER